MVPCMPAIAAMQQLSWTCPALHIPCPSHTTPTTSPPPFAQTISYQALMAELDVPTVRELEDFIITECFYTNVVKGKLDQKQHCLQVWGVDGEDDSTACR